MTCYVLVRRRSKGPRWLAATAVERCGRPAGPDGLCPRHEKVYGEGSR